MVIALIAFTVGIGVGFGVDWQGTTSSSGPCICEEGKISMLNLPNKSVKYFDFAEYLFIVGGSCFTNTEVVSLSKNKTKVPTCLSNLADHRVEVYYGAGGPLLYEGFLTYKTLGIEINASSSCYFSDKLLPHVCGSGSTHDPYDECWRFIASLNTWEKASNELPRDINAAAVAFQEDWGIIMAGGRKNDADCCSFNVTYTTSGLYFRDLALLPESKVYFCATGINSSHIFVTGLGGNDKSTYMYSAWTNQWQSLPPMPTGRRYTGCGVVRLEDGSTHVVVAGGLHEDGSNRVDTVEIYSIEEEEWRQGLSFSFK